MSGLVRRAAGKTFELAAGRGTAATGEGRLEPREFIRKWTGATLKERSAAQEHFIDLCRLLGEPTPAEDDPAGDRYCFERGARKDGGGKGWADVWKRGCFAWEYKGPDKDLDKAFDQLRRYALALENPPLLIVSNLARFRIRTNWTNTVSKTCEITLEELADAAVRDKLKWAMSDPERLRPGETRQALTEKAAATFAGLSHGLRERGHEPQAVAHFVNRLVFCMFAEDVGLLPDRMFTRMLRAARSRPESFPELAGKLFRAMSTGGMVGFEPVAWFNGDLFNDAQALPLERAEIETALAAAALDWSEIDPSILGILFERGLDPDKRAQLGAHYTDRDKVMLIVEPVIVRPLLAEWEGVKAEIGGALDRAGRAKSRPARTRQQTRAQRLLQVFLERLRAFTVLDPACGSGNFLYLALHALKDLEHRVQIEAEAMGLQRVFPAVGPANVRGIELNAYAAELARVSVWIGEVQWMRQNGFQESRDPILKPLETIECRDAILTPEGEDPGWPETDVVIGNPPFLGGKLLRRGLGGEYVEALRQVYGARLHGEADLVCYWVDKAQRMLEDGRAARAGLVATNSIRGGRNRSVLDRVAERGRIFDAWSDEPWVVDGAAVRVSLVAFEIADNGAPVRLNGMDAPRINADLTAEATDLTRARDLQVQRPFVGEHPLAVVAVTVVAPRTLALQMRVHLRIQRPLGHRLLQVVEQTAIGEHLGRIRPGQQLVQQLIAEPSHFACASCHALSSSWTSTLWSQTHEIPDSLRNRKGNGAHCLAVMRRLALNIARMHPGKMSMRSKFLHASWSYDFLLDMIRSTRRRM